MQVVYARQPFPDRVTRTIFLAEPTPRSPDVPSWRPRALCGMLHGSIGPGQLDGEVHDENRHAGTGCAAGGDPNPVVPVGSTVPMNATAM